LNIRPAEARDVAAVGALAEEAELFPAEMAAALLQPSLEEVDSDDIWLVAEEGDRLIGLAYTVPEKLTVGTYNMLSLGTARSIRGQGLGSALVDRTEQMLAERSARMLIVETSSQPAFDLTRRFYASRGYRQVARIPDFWDSGDDKIVFLKPILTEA
jgi:ribosomal protein S18 acetylase RimI-like enzyme